MAENFLWEKQSPSSTSDIENPPIAINDILGPENSSGNASANNNNDRDGSLTSKAVKLGFTLMAVAGAVTLGVVLTRSSSSDVSVASPSAPSASSISQNSIDAVSAVKSSKPEYYTSSGPFEARVKKVTRAITNGYDTCSDLESDITEALKLYINNFINEQAVTEELYAMCDPDNDNWLWDYYGWDNDYFYYDANFTCDAAGNTTTSCTTAELEVPWVLTWHEFDHAEGKLFYNQSEALEAYENVDFSYAKRLYCPYKMKVKEDGWMREQDWCELETWAYEAQCTGEAPATPTKKTVAKKTRSSLPKQTRSSFPGLEKQTRSRNHDQTKGKKRGDTKKDGDKKGGKSRASNGGVDDGISQNSQNEGTNEKDKVVSDGTNIYVAYGDILYAFPANDDTKEASITTMPGDASECDWDSADPCTSSTKPSIQALFLSNSHLTVVVSQSFWDYNSPADQTQPILTDYGSKVDVRVYDISTVTPGSPLNEVGHKTLTGGFMDGGSVGDRIVVTTTSDVDTYALVGDLYRYQDQYCGLDNTSYEELAAETAKGKAELFAKQMVSELELIDDCSKIFQISAMQGSSGDDKLELTEADFLLGSFVQVSTFDMSSDFGADGDIPVKVAGSFTAGSGYLSYLTDDFLALPSNVYRYNSTTDDSSYATFILGFDLSSDTATPYCYGQLPGDFSNKYEMDKLDNHLRVITSDYTSMDMSTWISSYLHKVFVLEIPDSPGEMSLVGKSSQSIVGEEGYVAASRFDGDKAYVSATDYDSSAQQTDQFVVVDLSDHSNPNVIGSLGIDSYLAYLQRIDINDSPFILGIGYGSKYPTYESYMSLKLIDISTPSSPQMAATFENIGSDSSASYDFLAIRYLPESQKLILPYSRSEYDENYMTINYLEGFAVYDISETSITSVYNVTHSTEENYCWYDAEVPARSFVVGSELITIRGHTEINSDMETGRFIAERDLDIGFDYSVCDDYYYGYGYHYDYMNDDGSS